MQRERMLTPIRQRYVTASATLPRHIHTLPPPSPPPRLAASLWFAHVNGAAARVGVQQLIMCHNTEPGVHYIEAKISLCDALAAHRGVKLCRSLGQWVTMTLLFYLLNSTPMQHLCVFLVLVELIRAVSPLFVLFFLHFS